MSANEFKDQEGVKPEWFSLVETDTRIPKNPRDRGIRVMALAGPLLLISAGLLFAQTTEGQNASATVDSSILASVKPGTSELARSSAGDVGVATDSVATSSASTNVSQSSSSTPVADRSQTAPSSTRDAVKPAVSTMVNPSTAVNTISPTATTQGFAPPAAGVSQASGDDDEEFEGNGEHDDDEDSYEHEDDDEGDDD
jgi:hypothetical protein